MIFQRLAASIRKRDWFTVVIELLVVAVGIVLGLQASEWDDRQAELKDEASTLARLESELAPLLSFARGLAEPPPAHGPRTSIP